ncbi:MAG: response regulator, partial [Lentisphaeria bacterium]|nr:response regulator [Lentisphaeria bacterium]
EYLNVHVACICLVSDKDSNILNLASSYAYTRRKNISNNILVGEGLVGQAALEKKQIVVSNVPDDYMKISSSLGESKPNFIVLSPVLHEDELLGVIETGFIDEVMNVELEYLEQSAEIIANSLRMAKNQEDISKALANSQMLSNDLQIHQNELQVSNDELASQSTRLKKSEEKLQVSNDELVDRQIAMQEQASILEQSSFELEERSKELALASKYKSEFLANMSHELRTPLNSFLLLSKNLSQNKKGNLDEEQVEDLNIIYECGTDLLLLINDIMDLSKVEAGKLGVTIEHISLQNICDNMKALFKASARDKSLKFETTVYPGITKTIESDSQRLEQILKNFLSNAFKFTSEGSIKLTVHQPDDEIHFKTSNLSLDSCIALSVTDTGIGIPQEKQREIFEAFQQEDGSTSRNYGGTGLGLTISRELTKLLGGEIQLKSTAGKGSTFTLYIPLKYSDAKENENDDEEDEDDASFFDVPKTEDEIEPHAILPSETDDLTASRNHRFVLDDRTHMNSGNEHILIIEDDEKFAKILLKIVHQNGSQALVAETGREGLYLALEHMPKGIFLDMGLPDMDGQAVLEQLKFHMDTKHIPVHIITGLENTMEPLQTGAIGILTKPVDDTDICEILDKIKSINNRDVKHALIVAEESKQTKISDLIANKGVTISCCATGKEVIGKITDKTYDCIILETVLADMTSFELLETLRSQNELKLPPVILYKDGELLSQVEQIEFDKYQSSMVLESAATPDILLDEAMIFMHSLSTTLSV